MRSLDFDEFRTVELHTNSRVLGRLSNGHGLIDEAHHDRLSHQKCREVLEGQS